MRSLKNIYLKLVLQWKTIRKVSWYLSSDILIGNLPKRESEAAVMDTLQG